ncbi:hypothetical protein FPZ24_08045 [Sphingomonas panacisoli]|uniref:Uncharacterized protein n=1 Tax=Sphingomonas panacisoli TaxID=1813879 RepID=A0A5B8LIK2_9SPHN|nr:hypothetical protein [Sphingomonas panacisoli]QDZ07434.1 hypothetical protein FPZ24_08045 [Sphingomonas panacisoli]
MTDGNHLVELADLYRVQPVEGGYQPEMRWTCKNGALWVPLQADGFWADPDAYSTGEVTVKSVMTLDDARRAVWLAQKENVGTPYDAVRGSLARSRATQPESPSHE